MTSSLRRAAEALQLNLERGLMDPGPPKTYLGKEAERRRVPLVRKHVPSAVPRRPDQRREASQLRPESTAAPSSSAGCT